MSRSSRVLKPVHLLTVVFLFSAIVQGCHPFHRLPSPSQTDIGIPAPARTQNFGTPYSYEHKVRADVYINRGDMTAGIRELKLAAKGDSADPHLQYQLAEAYLLTGDLERSRAHLTKSILIDPHNGKAWTLVAELQRQQGNAEGAFAAARYGSRVDRLDSSGFAWMGNYWAGQPGKSSQKKALNYYHRAIIRNGNDPDLYWAAGHCALQSNQLALAANYLSEYMNRYGQDHAQFHKLATRLLEQKFLDRAISLLQKMLLANPYDDDLRSLLVQAYLDTKEFPKATETVLAFFEAPSTPEEVAQRSDWLLAANAPWEARQFILSFSNGIPTDPLVRYQLAKVEWALRRDEVALGLLHFVSECPAPIMKKVHALQNEILSTPNFASKIP